MLLKCTREIKLWFKAQKKHISQSGTNEDTWFSIGEIEMKYELEQTDRLSAKKKSQSV